MTRAGAAALAAALLLAACAPATAPPRGEGDAVRAAAPAPASPAPAAAPAPAGPTATFVVAGREVPVRLEVARTPEERARGLMYRKQLAPGAGMIFLFERREVHAFWMKNTFIPLDMIFVDAEPGADAGVVVGVVHEAEPRTETPRSVGEPSRWVIEVPGGWAREQGIAAGAVVRVRGL